jgi:hypothetical protein
MTSTKGWSTTRVTADCTLFLTLFGDEWGKVVVVSQGE